MKCYLVLTFYKNLGEEKAQNYSIKGRYAFKVMKSNAYSKVCKQVLLSDTTGPFYTDLGLAAYDEILP